MLVRFRLGAPTAAEVTAFLVLAYAATIPLANFLIGHIGTVCDLDGPCLIPVFPGVLAPSGVLVIGAALVLRDLVQRRAGIPASLACVVVGAALSAVIAPPALVGASAAAFLFSELADFSVYTPLARRSFALAIAASCAAGALVDSALFLWLAFGSLEHLEGQVVGKVYAALAFLAWRALARANAAGFFRSLGRATRGALGWGSRTDPPFALDRCSPCFSLPTNRAEPADFALGFTLIKSSVLKALQNP